MGLRLPRVFALRIIVHRSGVDGSPIRILIWQWFCGTRRIIPRNAAASLVPACLRSKRDRATTPASERSIGCNSHRSKTRSSRREGAGVTHGGAERGRTGPMAAQPTETGVAPAPPLTPK